MSHFVRVSTLCVLFFLLCTVSFAQQYPYSGFPMFSTQLGSQYDQIDIADSNISLMLPLRSISSGPMPLNYVLFGASNVYKYLISPNYLWEVTSPSFSLVTNMGAQVGYSNTTSTTCNGDYDTLYTSFEVTDVSGTTHPLPTIIFDQLGCYTFPSGTYQTVDGSGYTVVLSGTTASWSTTVYDKSGIEYPATATYGSTGYTYTDSVVTPDKVAAQTITTPPASCNAGLTICTNTESITDALTSTPIINYQSTTGAPTTYTYTNFEGSTISPPYTVNYSNYTFATKFGCSGVTDYSGGAILPSSITTPTGGPYSFTYATTGRIASITLPSGGSISYAYTGGNSGINCNSGVVPTLTRTIKDNNGNINTWTYVNSNTSTGYPNYFTVVVTDPANNQTVYYMQQQFQTQVNSYQGGCPTSITGCAGGGSLLKTVTTCYNAVFTNCATPSSLIQGPPSANFSQTDVYTSYNGGSNNLVETKFDTLGDPIQVKQYDFGVAMGAAPTGSPLSNALTYYGQSWNGSACTAYPSGTYIYNTPCYTVTKNSAGTTVASTQITYSATGHPLSTSKWVSSSSSSLTASATYNSNGTIATATDVNGAVSTYYYNGTGGCNNLLPTSVVRTGYLIPSLTTASQWNCNGGVATQTTAPGAGAGGPATSYAYNDPLWRITSMTDPMQNVTSYSYASQTSFEIAMTFNGGSSTSDKLYTTDGLYRKIEVQTRTAPGASTFDNTISYGYSWNGTGFAPTQTIPGGTAVTKTQYDAIARPLSIVDGGGGTTSYTYAQNDVLQSVGPTQTFQKQFQYNGMGQLTSVCEINSLPGSGACGQTNAATGYLTSYSHDPLGDILGVNEVGQTRTYAYDGVARLTQETNPESGTTSYTYDSVSAPGTCGGWTSQPGDLLVTTYNDGSAVCSVHDGLHRLIRTGTTNTPNVCRSLVYDSATNGNIQSPPSGSSLVNLGGQLVEAETDDCVWPSPAITDEWYSYDADGHTTDVYQSTPNSGGFYHTTASYFANGAVNTLGGVPGLSGWTFGVDGEGRPYSATYNSSSPIDWVTSTTYYPSNPATTITYGDGDTDVYSFDATTGRMNQFQFNVTTQSLTGVLGWNANWTLGSLGITDGFNSANTQNCSYGYDALSRTNSVNCINGSTTVWTQNFTLDAFGNISKSGTSSFDATYGANNQEQTVGSCVPTYDGRGDLTTDCTFPTPYTYSWNSYGDPVTLNSDSLTWDALGREVEMDSGSNYGQILYGPTGKLGLMSGQTAVAIRVPLPGGSTAELLVATGGNVISHSDWLGSGRLWTTYKGQVVANDVSYAPYGEPYNSSSAAEESFTGQSHDTLAGLYDFLYRKNNPVQGRWLSPDPSGMSAVDPTNPQTWNRYAYVMNNPLSSVDPYGLANGSIGSTNVECPIPPNQSQAVCNGGYGQPGNMYFSFGFVGLGWDPLSVMSFMPEGAYLVDGGCQGCVNLPAGIVPQTGGCTNFVMANCGGSPPCTNYVTANCGAANNGQPKSPARQQCEANAQSSYRDTLENTAWQNTFVPFKAAGAGAISGGIIGCVLTVEGGCFEGAIPGALTGLFGGAAEGTIQAVSSDISGYRQAKGQLAAALAACQQIP
jgi:RHS repeat-associated protein